MKRQRLCLCTCVCVCVCVVVVAMDWGWWEEMHSNWWLNLKLFHFCQGCGIQWDDEQSCWAWPAMISVRGRDVGKPGLWKLSNPGQTSAALPPSQPEAPSQDPSCISWPITLACELVPAPRITLSTPLPNIFQKDFSNPQICFAYPPAQKPSWAAHCHWLPSRLFSLTFKPLQSPSTTKVRPLPHSPWVPHSSRTWLSRSPACCLLSHLWPLSTMFTLLELFHFVLLPPTHA